MSPGHFKTAVHILYIFACTSSHPVLLHLREMQNPDVKLLGKLHGLWTLDFKAHLHGVRRTYQGTSSVPFALCILTHSHQYQMRLPRTPIRPPAYFSISPGTSYHLPVPPSTSPQERHKKPQKRFHRHPGTPGLVSPPKWLNCLERVCALHLSSPPLPSSSSSSSSSTIRRPS